MKTGTHRCPTCGSDDIRFWGHSRDGEAWHICNRCGYHWDIPDSRKHAPHKPRWTREQKEQHP